MSEKLRGLSYLEQKYNLKLNDKKVLHQGDSLFNTVLNTNLGIDAKQLLSKKHALDFSRGLKPGNERAIKDQKSFNSHMPDILRRLDFYMQDEQGTQGTQGIKGSDISTSYEIDKIEEYTGQKISPEEKKEIENNNKEFEKEFEKLPTDVSKLKSVTKAGAGKVKKLFQKKNEPDVIGLGGDKSAEPSEKNELSDEKSNEPERESKQKNDEPNLISENEKHDNLTQEQENTLQKFKTQVNSKSIALLVLDKNGVIIGNYDSLSRFKNDKENYNKFKDNIKLSKRKVGISFVHENGDALYLVDKSKYREFYPTHTYISRNKKKFKKKKEEDEEENKNKNKNGDTGLRGDK